MKKIIKKPRSFFLPLVTIVAFFIGSLPILVVAYWSGSNFFYSHYIPKTCVEKISRSNLLIQPVRFGKSWDDGTTLYFFPTEIRIGSVGYAYFAKEYDTKTCQQQLTIKGTVSNQQTRVVTQNSSLLTIELVLTESKKSISPYMISETLEKLFSNYIPNSETGKTNKMMNLSKQLLEKSLNDPSDRLYTHGTAMITEINGITTQGGPVKIMQQDGNWIIENDL